MRPEPTAQELDFEEPDILEPDIKELDIKEVDVEEPATQEPDINSELGNRNWRLALAAYRRPGVPGDSVAGRSAPRLRGARVRGGRRGPASRGASC